MTMRAGGVAFKASCAQLDQDIEKLQSSCLSLTCEPGAPYRRHDGCCNSLESRLRGSANTALPRLLAPAYSDGVSLPRGGLTSSLPSPRAVSVAVHQAHEENNHRESISQMVMQWGQFLDHDTSLIQGTVGPSPCCLPDFIAADSSKPEDVRSCFNIDVADDIFYKNHGFGCFPFTRATAICSESKVREQFNAITSFIDGNQVYGSDKQRADKLRTKSDGLLKTHYLGPTLPTNRQAGFVDGSPLTNPPGAQTEDLVAGDIRVQQHPGLAAVQSLFLLEHNRIAREYKKLDPSLTDDEQIYQLARRLVAAQMQNIVYSEFLPIVLGEDKMKEFKLTLPQPGSCTEYYKNVDASITNDFSSFAYRFGHSLIPNSFSKKSNLPLDTESNFCPLKDNFFKIEDCVVGQDLRANAWKSIIMRMTAIQSPAMDAKMQESATNFLFCTLLPKGCSLTQGFGLDLASMNIQRGRDNGIPGYIKYRRYCGLSVPRNWEDKPEDISQSNWENMRSVYTSVDQIDAFTGTLSEKSVPGGLVGPTNACILGKQFRNLIVGDRFFFTHPSDGNNHEKGLASGVRSWIQKRKLSNIICDNIDGPTNR